MKNSDPPHSSSNDPTNNLHTQNTHAVHTDSIEYLTGAAGANSRRSLSSLNSSTVAGQLDRTDPDQSTYSPSSMLSQRFTHESDSEMEQDDQDDSDHTEGEANASAVKSASRAKVLNKRLSTFDHRHDPCQQRVYLEEEDVELIFTGYRFVRSRVYLYYLLCLLSCGIIFLLGRWLPRRYIAFVAQKCEMSKAECIVVQNEYGQLSTERIFTKYYGGPIDSVFSPGQMEKPQGDDTYDETVVGIFFDERRRI
ncbi:hypothetical protein KVV02_005188 [Mortierella alpina]|uniref:Cation-transporting ATPase n=1 Tax=Mortierella alpina TaxID=64518 RepID=A0A9P8A6Q2_MORAP|nr:hypothetical protein KVV02_005188 [Mortierella alpina]